MSDQILHADDASFATLVTDQPGLVLVDFHAVWCGPCVALAPTLARLAADYAGRVRVVKVDVDAAPGTAMQYGIRSMPTVLLFRDGTPVQSIVGLQPKARYADALAVLGASPAAAASA
jgi:thioredoxin 1